MVSASVDLMHLGSPQGPVGTGTLAMVVRRGDAFGVGFGLMFKAHLGHPRGCIG